MIPWTITVIALLAALYLAREIDKLKDELEQHKIIQSEVLDEYRRTADRIMERLKRG